MRRTTYAWKLQVVVMSITMATGYVSNLDYEYVSCRESKRRCFADTSCRAQFNSIEELCGDSVYKCPSEGRLGCRRLLTSLQTLPVFRSCNCKPEEAHAVECYAIFNTIFLHNCVNQDGTHLNLSVLASQQQQQQPTDHLDEDDEDAPDGTTDEEDRDFPSCIGIRKYCLQEKRCSHLLSDYRNQCRENKKQNECVATDRLRCFRAINLLRDSRPELFHCACPMKRHDTKVKCERIQWRLANNTCLVTVPYLVHTLPDRELSYDDLYDTAFKQRDGKNEIAGSCVAAFKHCHLDSNCRPRLSRLIGDCSLGASIAPPQPLRNVTQCDRKSCQEAIRAFFLLVRPDLTHGLLFCRCNPGDEGCGALRKALSPPCTLVQLPPPTCLDLYQRCSNDSDCRLRWKNFDRYCSWSRGSGGCHSGPDMCRSSIVGIRGTDLTINCTCALADEDAQKRCVDLRTKLHESNTCIDSAIENFHLATTTTTTTTITTTKLITSTTTTSKQRAPIEYSLDGSNQLLDGSSQSADSASQSDTSMVVPECNRLKTYGSKIPLFMNMPPVIRIYSAVTECSQVCHCEEDGLVTCKTLPCLPKESCKLRGTAFFHGTSISIEGRGSCRCFKSNIVCAKPHVWTEPSPGLFLHSGYSQADQELVEANSDVQFDPKRVTMKLSTLLNEDSANQFCNLSLYTALDGNLIFQVHVSEHSPNHLKEIESCMIPANTLASQITDRHGAIISDAELSILKVAQVERIKFIEAPATSGARKEPTRSAGSASSVYRNLVETVTALFYCLAMSSMVYAFTTAWKPTKRDDAVVVLVSS